MYPDSSLVFPIIEIKIPSRYDIQHHFDKDT